MHDVLQKDGLLPLLAPLVVGLGAGGEMHKPLAIAVVGGLAFSTAATLFVVPSLAGLSRARRAVS
jgi:multidrug efflux pump subunit AcrB